MLLVAAAGFFALHYAHLTADFPNHSPWMDWSKYTDEGWYGDAAIRHFQRGSWYVAGDFNPAAALPVWPFLEGLVFRVTGVSLVAARALTVTIFGGILVASYLLLRRWEGSGATDEQGSRRDLTLAPAIAVLLLAVNPFCFAFTRLAILEPVLVFLTLLAFHAASAAPGAFKAPRSLVRRLMPTAALGVLLPALVLTKTTAVFLLPSILFLLWAAAGYRTRLFVQIALRAGLPAVGLWCGYFFFLVRPHYLEDYRYLFSANGYTGITVATALPVIRDTLIGGLWFGNILYPLALIAVPICVVRWIRTRGSPLAMSLVLWAMGYAAFLAYHDNLQPRYYLVVAVPMTLLVADVFGRALQWFGRAPEHSSGFLPAPALALGSALLLGLTVVAPARQTLSFVRHPEYTLVQAAAQVARIVQADTTHRSLLLSISGSDISLMTGLPSICDDFGTLDLPDRVKLYRPGWYAAWNELDDDKMDSLTPLYRIERVAAFPAMDDPARNLLILYRLDPAAGMPPIPRRRKPTPKPLRTPVGQQPSTEQLKH